MPETTINLNNLEQVPVEENKLDQKGSTPLKLKPPALNIFKMSHKELAPLYVILALTFVLYFVSRDFLIDQKSKTDKYITVYGTSSKQVMNEIANFTASVQVTDTNKETAVEGVNTKAEAVVSFIKSYGIPEEDIKTTNMSVYQIQEPILSEGVQKTQPGDWRAYMSVEVKYRDVSSVNEFAKQLALQDLSDFWGPNFTIDEKQNDDSDLMDAAFQDALSKAEKLASVSGRELSEVVSIVEGYSSSPVPLMLKAEGMGGGGMGLEPGSTESYKTLTVTFKLK